MLGKKGDGGDMSPVNKHTAERSVSRSGESSIFRGGHVGGLNTGDTGNVDDFGRMVGVRSLLEKWLQASRCQLLHDKSGPSKLTQR